MFYPKRDGEFGVGLPTVLVLEVREENVLDTLDSILRVRDGIEGDSCWLDLRFDNNGGNRVISDVRRNCRGMRRRVKRASDEKRTPASSS